MNREEAIAKGLEVHDTQHSMKRRSPWHDYHKKGTYMLTLVVEGRVPILGRLTNGPARKAEATVLGYKDPSRAISDYVDSEDKTTLLIQQSGSNYKLRTCVFNESGLYSLILSSKLPQARG